MQPITTFDGVVVGSGHSIDWAPEDTAFGGSTSPAFDSTWGIVTMGRASYDSTVWFVETNGDSNSPHSKFAKWDPYSHQIQEFDGPDASIFDLAVGGDGNVYFTEDTSSPTVGVLDAQTGTYGTYITSSQGSQALTLARDSNGTVWFNGYDDIGTVDANGIDMDLQSPLTGHTFVASQMTADANGNMWFSGTQDAGLYSVSETGAVTEHDVAQSIPGASIVIGKDAVLNYSDASMWVGLAVIGDASDSAVGAVAKFDTDGTETTYTTPILVAGNSPTALTEALAPAGDGGIWLQQASGSSTIGGQFTDIAEIDGSGNGTGFDTGGRLDPSPAGVEMFDNAAWSTSSGGLYIRKTNPYNPANSGREMMTPTDQSSGTLSAPTADGTGVLYVLRNTPGHADLFQFLMRQPSL